MKKQKILYRRGQLKLKIWEKELKKKKEIIQLLLKGKKADEIREKIKDVTDFEIFITAKELQQALDKADMGYLEKYVEVYFDEWKDDLYLIV